MAVVFCEMVSDARDRSVHIGTSEFFCSDDLAGSGLHQRRSCQIYGALISYYDGLVAHRWNVGSACSTHAHHYGDLRYSHRRHTSLVVEETTEMISVREYCILFREECTATVDHIDAWQFILHCNLLSAKMFLHGVLHISAAFHRGVVGDNHRLSALYDSDAGDDTGGREVVVISVVGSHRREFQEWSVLVDELVDALASEKFVTFLVLLYGSSTAALHTQ